MLYLIIVNVNKNVLYYLGLRKKSSERNHKSDDANNNVIWIRVRSTTGYLRIIIYQWKAHPSSREFNIKSCVYIRAHNLYISLLVQIFFDPSYGNSHFRDFAIICNMLPLLGVALLLSRVYVMLKHWKQSFNCVNLRY